VPLRGAWAGAAWRRAGSDGRAPRATASVRCRRDVGPQDGATAPRVVVRPESPTAPRERAEHESGRDGRVAPRCPPVDKTRDRGSRASWSRPRSTTAPRGLAERGARRGSQTLGRAPRSGRHARPAPPATSNLPEPRARRRTARRGRDEITAPRGRAETRDRVRPRASPHSRRHARPRYSRDGRKRARRPRRGRRSRALRETASLVPLPSQSCPAASDNTLSKAYLRRGGNGTGAAPEASSVIRLVGRLYRRTSGSQHGRARRAPGSDSQSDRRLRR
jgi:hypothetical protein